MERKVEIHSLDELIRHRQGWIKTTAENDFNFEDILAGLYADPSHFIYELLQNAEDAGATSISFNLLPDRFDVKYDGRPFNLRDVVSITAVCSSTKKDQVEQIGKFGIGFKSVFAVTKTPIIDSGPFHFKIIDFVLPEPIGSPSDDEYVYISLPFNHDQSVRSPLEIHQVIESKLCELKPSCLLFLKNISRID